MTEFQMETPQTDDLEIIPKIPRKKSSFSSATPNPSRPIRYLVHARRQNRSKSNAAFVEEETNETDESEPEPSNQMTTYGYLEHIQSIKPLFRPDDKSLPKKVREYYEDQVELITSIEDILLPKDNGESDHATAYEKRQKKIIKILTMTTLVTNILLVILKIVGAVISRSLSVISSVVDSVVDLLTSVILIWTAHKIKNRDAYKYPGGRTRLEPIAVVILSVIMCSASVQVIFESAETLEQDIEYFTNRNKGNSSGHSLPHIDMSIVPIVAMVATIVSKSILFVLCYRIKNPSMYALAEDSRNDVASNIVALICGLIASHALHGSIKQEAIVIDPIGAIIISVYIIIAWILQANRQIRNLTGLSAEPEFLQRLTHVVYNFQPKVMTRIDSVQAVHVGTDFFTEVDIVLPGSMPLEKAHDIGIELQNQLETIVDIERAYVHLDFEVTHMPPSEHKII